MSNSVSNYVERYDEERPKNLGIVLSCGKHSFNKGKTIVDDNRKSVIVGYPTILYSITQLLNLDCDDIVVIIDYEDGFEFYNTLLKTSDIFPEIIKEKIHLRWYPETRYSYGNTDIYYLFNDCIFNNIKGKELLNSSDRIIIMKENIIPYGNISMIEEVVRQFYKETCRDDYLCDNVFGSVYYDYEDRSTKETDQYSVDFCTKEVFLECARIFKNYIKDIYENNNNFLFDNFDNKTPPTIYNYMNYILKADSYIRVKLDARVSKYNFGFMDINDSFHQCDKELRDEQDRFGKNSIIKIYEHYLVNNLPYMDDVYKYRDIMRDASKAIDDKYKKYGRFSNNCEDHDDIK